MSPTIVVLVIVAAAISGALKLAQQLREADRDATTPERSEARKQAPTRSSAVSRASASWGQARVLDRGDLDEMDEWFKAGDNPADYK